MSNTNICVTTSTKILIIVFFCIGQQFCLTYAVVLILFQFFWLEFFSYPNVFMARKILVSSSAVNLICRLRPSKQFVWVCLSSMIYAQFQWKHKWYLCVMNVQPIINQEIPRARCATVDLELQCVCCCLVSSKSVCVCLSKYQN